MLINNQFKKIIENKYDEMVKTNQTSSILDEKALGGIMIFIDIKPSFCLVSLEIDKRKIYVGSNT